MRGLESNWAERRLVKRWHEGSSSAHLSLPFLAFFLPPSAFLIAFFAAVGFLPEVGAIWCERAVL